MFNRRYLQPEKKNGEMGAEKILDNLRVSKRQEIFTTVAIVCRRYERLAVLQNVFAHYFGLSKKRL